MGVDTWREQLLWIYGSGVEGERGSYDGSDSLFNTALKENGRCMLNNPFAPKLEWSFSAGLGSLRQVGEATASFLGDQIERMWGPKVDCPSSSSHRLPLQTYAEMLIGPFVGINWYELSSPASVAQDRRMTFSLLDSLAAACGDLTGRFWPAGGCGDEDAGDVPDDDHHLLRESYRVNPSGGLLPCADLYAETVLRDSFAGSIDVRTFPDGWPGSTRDDPANDEAGGGGGGGGAVASLFFWFFPARDAQDATALATAAAAAAPAAAAAAAPQPPAPLILWLQGGPGTSSMIGLFHEVGPLALNARGEICLRRCHWNRRCALLFVDNPVGTGYSFVGRRRRRRQESADGGLRGPGGGGEVPAGAAAPDGLQREPRVAAMETSGAGFDDDRGDDAGKEEEEEGDGDDEDGTAPKYAAGYAANQPAVAADLVAFLLRFYRVFPDLRAAPLYVVGQSYAGKYVPHFADAVALHNDRLAAAEMAAAAGSSRTEQAIPLRGIALGNGLTDPPSQLDAVAPQALALGLVSAAQAAALSAVSRAAAGLARQRRWRAAARRRAALFASLRAAMGGAVSLDDVRRRDPGATNEWAALDALLAGRGARAALHVPELEGCGGTPRRQTASAAVMRHLAGDAMKSAAGAVARVLRRGGVRVLLYQAQFDLRDGVMGSNAWIAGLQWDGREGFAAAERRVWRLRGRGGSGGGCDGEDGDEDGEGEEEEEGEVVGFVTEYGQLRRVELLRAGHLAPLDAPVAAREMIEDFLFLTGHAL
ncbi:Alpha/Beta hydrolase protein [Zopfochytrium polystomum]|nr:Alpha/Beta hydrolase protein [Zopfochytrium polystomum]